MREYIRNITKTNDLILNGTLGNDEIDRFSKSDYRWADNKRKSFQTRKIKKGEIYQFEFGKNFVPEMSYEHRGLLMDGRLNEYLHEIDTQCYEKVELLVEQMKAGAGITEELKATDQMKWVGLMNNVRSSAEEIVLKELIYV